MPRIMRIGLLATAASLAVASSAFAAAAGQRHFDSAEAAVAALVDAATRGDRAELRPMFGPEADEIFSSGDPVADREARERFVERAAERTHLERIGDDFAVLSIGHDDWPFAIPLMKDRSGWYFATDVGRAELVNRRIGRNELRTIQVSREYVSAQREYARRRAAETGVREYAQRIRSTPGKRDGLYWEVGEDEEESPIGPLFAAASGAGYDVAENPGRAREPQPFYGYVYRVLHAAGPSAPGGAGSYIKEGRMTGGFALVAYPVRYGASGIMTFQVNEQGVVFEKDLGPRTAEIASRIRAYDPDLSWHPTE